VIVRPHPFKLAKIDYVLLPGKTIQEIIDETFPLSGYPGTIQVSVNGIPIAADQWKVFVPSNGAHVLINAVPHGGGGEEGGKDPLRIFLTIVVLVASIVVPQSAFLVKAGVFWQAAAALAITALGTILINALIPPPRPKSLASGDDTGAIRLPGITGARNSINLFGPIPVVLGSMRVVPPHGANPYTEISANEQYLRMLFVVGYGELQMIEPKIGDTLLSEYNDVEWEMKPGSDTDTAIVTYQNDIDETPLNVELTNPDGGTYWFTQSTSADDTIQEISVDITFPQGLVTFDSLGNRGDRTVDFEIQYRAKPAGDWSVLSSFTAVSSQVSGAFAVVSDKGTSYTLPFRYDRVILNKATGTIQIIQGIEAWVSFVLVGGFGTTYRPIWKSAEPPAVPSWATSLAKIARYEDTTNVSASDITDERGADLDKENAGDFLVTAQSPEANAVDVAAGGLRLVVGATAASPDTIRIGYRFEVDGDANGYDVRMRRKTTENPSNLIYDSAYWTALREISYVDPINKSGLAQIAIRIRASDQLSGVISNFNVVASSVCLDWDTGTATWIERATNNPASLFRYVLQHPANKKALANSVIDLTTLQTWHEFCAPNINFIDTSGPAVDKGGGLVGIPVAGHGYADYTRIIIADTTYYDGPHEVHTSTTTNEIVITATYSAETFVGTEEVSDIGLTYNSYVQDRISVLELMQEIASAGRATPVYIDGQYSVAIDTTKTTPIQHVTMHNAWGFKSSKSFIESPHALRIPFANELKGYIADELIVYDDGYDSGSATIYETLELPGVTNEVVAYKHARYHMAAARLRPELYTFNMDVENILCTRGDLIRATYDVPLWGVSSGRVKSITTSGGNITHVEVDNICTMTGGNTYSARFRKDDGSSVVVSIVLNVGEQTTLELTTPILIASGPAVGDLALFGETGTESVELVVLDISRSNDLSATISALDYSPAIFTADTGEIPDFDSQVTIPYVPFGLAPTIRQVRSDESVMYRAADGTLQPRMVITLDYPAGYLATIKSTILNYRENGSDEQYRVMQFPQFSKEIWVSDVEEGLTYEIRVAYETDDGITEWASTTHAVTGKTNDPAQPTAISAAGSIYGVEVSWTNPSDVDFSLVSVWRNTSDSFPGGDPLGVVLGKAAEDSSYLDTTAVYDTTYYYFLKSFDTSGNSSDETSSVNSKPGTNSNQDLIGDTGSGDIGIVFLDGSSNVIFQSDGTTYIVGGWVFDNEKLSSLSADIILHSQDEQITISDELIIGDIGGGEYGIESTNYTPGSLGTGFKLTEDLLEVGNIAARGVIRSGVFQKDVVSAIGGNLAITKGSDVLAVDMTAADASTLTIEGNETFAVNDILRIKDETYDEWLLVTNIGSAPTYTVTRDQASVYSPDANPVWTKGATVVNYGASGDGGVFITASESNAPYMSIFTHVGSPWSALTTRLRLGNLNGYLGYTSDLYGIGIGEANKYVKYDPTNGLRIKGDVTISDGGIVSSAIQLTSQGYIRTSESYPYIELSNSGVQLKTSDTGGSYSSALYSTDKYGFGATVWLMNSDLWIPWYETKEPQDGSANDMPSLRLYNRSADPTGGSYQTGDICVVLGELKIYTSGAWVVVGTQS
jgi:hypothetical protein